MPTNRGVLCKRRISAGSTVDSPSEEGKGSSVLSRKIVKPKITPLASASSKKTSTTPIVAQVSSRRQPSGSQARKSDYSPSTPSDGKGVVKPKNTFSSSRLTSTTRSTTPIGAQVSSRRPLTNSVAKKLDYSPSTPLQASHFKAAAKPKNVSPSSSSSNKSSVTSTHSTPTGARLSSPARRLANPAVKKLDFSPSTPLQESETLSSQDAECDSGNMCPERAGSSDILKRLKEMEEMILSEEDGSGIGNSHHGWGLVREQCINLHITLSKILSGATVH